MDLNRSELRCFWPPMLWLTPPTISRRPGHGSQRPHWLASDAPLEETRTSEFGPTMDLGPRDGAHVSCRVETLGEPNHRRGRANREPRPVSPDRAAVGPCSSRLGVPGFACCSRATARSVSRLVSQRTGIINQIRAFLLERGHRGATGTRFLRVLDLKEAKALLDALGSCAGECAARLLAPIRTARSDQGRLAGRGHQPRHSQHDR